MVIYIGRVTIQLSPSSDPVKECLISRVGREYMGQRDTDSQGQHCVSWTLEDLTPNLAARLPDDSVVAANSYCRLVAGRGWRQPSCLIYHADDSMYKHSPCEIPYCRKYSVYRAKM